MEDKLERNGTVEQEKKGNDENIKNPLRKRR